MVDSRPTGNHHGPINMAWDFNSEMDIKKMKRHVIFTLLATASLMAFFSEMAKYALHGDFELIFGGAILGMLFMPIIHKVGRYIIPGVMPNSRKRAQAVTAILTTLLDVDIEDQKDLSLSALSAMYFTARLFEEGYIRTSDYGAFETSALEAMKVLTNKDYLEQLENIVQGAIHAAEHPNEEE